LEQDTPFRCSEADTGAGNVTLAFSPSVLGRRQIKHGRLWLNVLPVLSGVQSRAERAFFEPGLSGQEAIMKSGQKLPLAQLPHLCLQFGDVPKKDVCDLNN
jgi:hypothetical protein